MLARVVVRPAAGQPLQLSLSPLAAAETRMVHRPPRRCSLWNLALRRPVVGAVLFAQRSLTLLLRLKTVRCPEEVGPGCGVRGWQAGEGWVGVGEWLGGGVVAVLVVVCV